jgi:hypothetical protein
MQYLHVQGGTASSAQTQNDIESLDFASTINYVQGFSIGGELAVPQLQNWLQQSFCLLSAEVIRNFRL